MKRLAVALASIIVLSAPVSALADSGGFGFGNGGNYSARLKPQDYLFAPNPEVRNDLFETLRPVELGVNLAVGSDCGKINIEGTFRSTFGKFIGGDYFKGMAQDIVGSAPMLAACYMSPTWCAILKHTQLSANLLTQVRLDQCQIINKYTDSRVDDYYRERQSCVQRSIQQNGGDMEAALSACQGNVFEAKAGRWAGSQDNPNAPNQLIADSTRWAGFQGAEGTRITDLIKSMVGDTVLTKGSVRVEYGPRAHAYSPRSYLMSLENQIGAEFCGKLLPEIADGRDYISDADIERRMKALPSSGSEGEVPMLTADVVRNLSFLPPTRRERICMKLSQAMATQSFTRDMNRSIDVLTAATQNPNLPPNRKQEIEGKRQALKDQVDLTLRLRQEQARPAGEVMKYIAEEGLAAQDDSTRRRLEGESATYSTRSHAQRMNDCADGVFCPNRPVR